MQCGRAVLPKGVHGQSGRQHETESRKIVVAGGVGNLTTARGGETGGEVRIFLEHGFHRGFVFQPGHVSQPHCVARAELEAEEVLERTCQAAA